MPPKKKEGGEKWETSKSKALLRRGIIDRTIPSDMTPAAVFAMNPEEHGKWPRKNWTNNLGNLRKAIERDRERMALDARDFGHDMAIVKKMHEKNPVPVPWHKTHCPKLLKKDMDDGLHLELEPKQLYMKRKEYQAFTLTVFCNHIYQEVDCRPKREMRFERKKKGWKYPELHEGHLRLQG
jgi:hypothetical protein